MMLHTPIGQTEISIPLPGEHMVYNALAAAATGCQLGLTLKEIADGIASVSPTGGRSHIIRTGKNVVIDDCYNANPVSMCAALDLLTLAEGRKVAILGDMFELGENAGQMHAQVGEYAVTCGIDLIICVGEQSEYMADAARRAAEEQNRTDKNNVRYYRTKAELISELSGLIQPGDTVLVKASHGMEFPEIVTLLEENGRKSC
jgi:UDP-N-acetylmuramoyl-tripeptide--D-alanyl-D-alanine ligase